MLKYGIRLPLSVSLMLFSITRTEYTLNSCDRDFPPAYNHHFHGDCDAEFWQGTQGVK